MPFEQTPAGERERKRADSSSFFFEYAVKVVHDAIITTWKLIQTIRTTKDKPLVALDSSLDGPMVMMIIINIMRRHGPRCLRSVCVLNG